jgi:membrane protease YdiL (CAAX protease family)
VVVNAAVSALMNLLLLGGIPLALYFAYHRRRKRSAAEIARRAGLRLGHARYIGYSALFTLAIVAAFVIWAPPVEPFTREGSPQQAFVGLGLSGPAVAMALLYGVIKTGLSEEVLFRGLIAGSLSRRLPLRWANLIQAFIFLLPHFVVLRLMPEMWPFLPVVFAGALFLGWVRIRSGSILGPWLVHATLNVVTCLSVAIRTAT